MAKARVGVVLTTDIGKMEATLFGLPLTYEEAHAYSDLNAGFATARQREVFTAWLVRMTLSEGFWVSEALAGLIKAHVPDLTCPSQCRIMVYGWS
jgi:hypothetical protein